MTTPKTTPKPNTQWPDWLEREVGLADIADVTGIPERSLSRLARAGVIESRRGKYHLRKAVTALMEHYRGGPCREVEPGLWEIGGPGCYIDQRARLRRKA